MPRMLAKMKQLTIGDRYGLYMHVDNILEFRSTVLSVSSDDEAFM